MRALVGSAVKLEVEEDEGALPSYRLVMFVALVASAQEEGTEGMMQRPILIQLLSALENVTKTKR
jgi:hypothetical protein